MVKHIPRPLKFAIIAFLACEFVLLTWLDYEYVMERRASLQAAMLLPASLTLWTGFGLSWLAGRFTRARATRRDGNELRDVGRGVPRLQEPAERTNRIGRGK